MRISDWSSDVCSSDLREQSLPQVGPSLLVGADPHPGGGVVGDGDLRGSVVDDLPQLGADQPEVVALQQAGGVGLVDEVFNSEERRVGKKCGDTCRSRWSPHNYKKKNKHNDDTQNN